MLASFVTPTDGITPWEEEMGVITFPIKTALLWELLPPGET